MSPEHSVLILDIGSHQAKAGLADPDFGEPSIVMPTSICRDFKTNEVVSVGKLDYDNPTIVNRPVIRDGIITSFDDYGELVDKLVQSAGLHDLSSTSVVISDFIARPVVQRNKIAELMLEKHQAAQISFANSCILALGHYGRTTGTVVEMGHAITQAVSVFDGYRLRPSEAWASFGGATVTTYLDMLLHKEGYHFDPRLRHLLVSDIKETLCKVADMKTSAMLKLVNSTGVVEDDVLTLPDGGEVQIGRERYLAPEVIFDSSILSAGFKGLPVFLADSLDKVNIDLRRKLVENIYLTGGVFNLEGFGDRLSEELAACMGKRAKVGVMCSNHPREYVPWMGANVMAVSGSGALNWLDKAEYSERGVDHISL